MTIETLEKKLKPLGVPIDNELLDGSYISICRRNLSRVGRCTMVTARLPVF